MAERILITGGAGFIGSNFIRKFIGRPDIEIVNIDALTYAGNLGNLSDIEHQTNYHFVKGSIGDEALVRKTIGDYEINGIINFAAESHVDRSILNSKPFIDTNVAGTLTLLDAAREFNINRFLQVSTDEVYGSLGADGLFTEETPVSPNSPYSASKASADHLVQAYHETYGLPTVITRCSNNYGPFQFPEKLIPLMILNALEDKDLPVYGDGLNVRDWIHVEDHCEAIYLIFAQGRDGDVYNIGGNAERTNIEIVKLLLSILGKPESLIKFVKDRPGHDRRYAIDSAKIETTLRWNRRIAFEEGIRQTVDWYLASPQWCDSVRSGGYMDYYTLQYGASE